MGHEVWMADCGDVVCDEAPLHKPHLILLNIMMPGVDGFEAARRLSLTAPGATLVALSGLASESDKRKALEAGFDEHIAKPAAAETLSRLLDSITEHAFS